MLSFTEKSSRQMESADTMHLAQGKVENSKLDQGINEQKIRRKQIQTSLKVTHKRGTTRDNCSRV